MFLRTLKHAVAYSCGLTAKSKGRFLNADKHTDICAGVNGTNMFAYCNNNPVVFIDPSGEVGVGFVVAGVSIPTAYLICSAVLLILLVDVFTGGKIVLTMSDAIALIIEYAADSITSNIVLSKKTKIPSKLKVGNKVKTPDSHPSEFQKNKDGTYTHKKTGWKYKKDKSGHYGGDHWDLEPKNGQPGDYHSADLTGKVLK